VDQRHEPVEEMRRQCHARPDGLNRRDTQEGYVGGRVDHWGEQESRARSANGEILMFVPHDHDTHPRLPRARTSRSIDRSIIHPTARREEGEWWGEGRRGGLQIDTRFGFMKKKFILKGKAASINHAEIYERRGMGRRWTVGMGAPAVHHSDRLPRN